MASNIDYTKPRFWRWMRKEIFRKKLTSPLANIVLVLIAVAFGFFAAKDLIVLNFGLTFAIAGLAIVYCCIFQPLIGFYLMSTIAFFIFYPSHLLRKDLPITPGVEVLVVFVFLGTVLKARKERKKENKLFKTPVSIGLTITFIYIFLEVINPNISGMGLGGWVSTFKRFVFLTFIYVVTYRLLDTPAKLKFYLKYWIILSFIGGLYGCFQQWFGYLPPEMDYITAKPEEFALMNQGGLLRKFSFFSDVVSFGILSGSMAVLTLILGVNTPNKKYKYILFFFTLILMMGMAYSGTRTALIILPAGLALYGMMTVRNKTTLLTLFVSVLLIAAVLFAPVTNSTLYRIRTIFDSKEESMNVRDRNRHNIQPYIYANPFGGGLSTSGIEGKRFYPAHPLAGFPPDSGLLKAALETGWLGLAITIIFDLLILYQGIWYHSRIRNPEYGAYVAAIVCTLFPIIVSQYSQVAIGQIPGAIFFYGALTLIQRLMEFDLAEQKN
ncbi:O-antigen ligase family protein [Ferruginibacter albus]|uniref:O-antigen ligase family protein n=1 Tax=Ferruginibacter albus TaxID=2875540 RepID=UPI001CC7F8DB|nr:O-antigen ligase family protein [Ferruginibacter albus]UAY51325.1 O-antigen ligase family protein [Ferruginibacter albus]